jgi:subfamily B ATP-binding cassette protein MsbA
MKRSALFRRTFSFVRPYWHILALSIVLSLLIVVFETVSLWVIATLADTLFSINKGAPSAPMINVGSLNAVLKQWVHQLTQAGTPQGTLARVCLIFGASFLLKNSLTYINSLIISSLNLRVIQDIRNAVYRHVLMLPVSYYDRNKSGAILSIILNDVGRLNFAMTNTITKSFAEPIRLITFWTLLFVISTKLTLVVFLIYPVLILLITRIGKSVRRRSKRTLENLGGLTSVLHETVNCVRAVKMFNMNEAEATKFKTENRRFIRNSFRSTRTSAITSPLTEVLGLMVAVSLLWIGGTQVLAGKGMTAEDFIRYLTLLIFSYQPLKALAGINNATQAGLAAAERVVSVLDTPAEDYDVQGKITQPPFTKDISFNNVSFTYPGTTDEVLHDVSFSVKKGTVVALVGSSGAGKSTILDLLPRFYEVSKGTVTVDGTDVTGMSLVGLRSLFGIVAQETILFNDTVFNNISYGVKDATMDAARDAARAANALEFIDKLPKGFETLIGERGVMLSGGQCQRLSIARALLRNPPILILDEATSSLDTESERLVQAAIDNLIQNRTVVVVAHRLSTVRNADTILVLDKGQIVERGTHDQLMALGSRYKYFHDLQFSTKARGEVA